MSHRSKLDRLVDETLHAVILEFTPDLPNTYRRCVEALKRLEQSIEEATVRVASKRSLLVRVRTLAASMASEMEDHAEVERLTANLLELASPKDPDFATIVLLRTETLHLLGRHEEEVAEALGHVRSKVVKGQVLIHLLAKLARRHPEEIEWTDSLVSPIKGYASRSPELEQLLQRLPIPEDNREYVLRIAEIARQVNLERTARLLEEPPEG